MKKEYTYFFTIVACIGLGAAAVYFPNKKAIEFGNKFKVVYKIEDYLENEGISAKEIESNDKSFINEYLKLRYDKYTYFSPQNPKQDAVDFVNSMPTAIGSGFVLEYDENDRLIFSNVEKNSWAEQSGFRTGDVIISIDGENIENLGDSAAKKIAGKDNTECDVVIEHEGSQKTIHFVRHNYESNLFENVDSEIYGDILYIHINRMGEYLNDEFNGEIKKYKYNSMVLDLRNNKGGITNSALQIANMFLSEGYMNTYSYSGEDIQYEITDKEKSIDVPVVLLINENTASAAEILTGLLKQFGDVTLVGTNTFGKGIFQSDAIFMGGILHYTNGYFTVGDWECWQGKGIAPDIEIPMDNTLIGSDDDIQLQKAFEILQK